MVANSTRFETLMMVPIADTEEEFAEEVKSGPIKHFNIRVSLIYNVVTQ